MCVYVCVVVWVCLDRWFVGGGLLFTILIHANKQVTSSAKQIEKWLVGISEELYIKGFRLNVLQTNTHTICIQHNICQKDETYVVQNYDWLVSNWLFSSGIFIQTHFEISENSFEMKKNQNKTKNKYSFLKKKIFMIDQKIMFCCSFHNLDDTTTYFLYIFLLFLTMMYITGIYRGSDSWR